MIFRKLATLLATLLISSDAIAQISIFPESPKALETVRVRVPQGTTAAELFDPRGTRVSIDGSRITVTVVATPAQGQSEPLPALDLPLGQFPAGSFNVDVHVVTSTGTPVRSLGTAVFTVPARTSEEPLWNLTDLWWTPEESGWGINMIQHGSGIIFATWFVYGADGKATWYVIPDGRWIAGGLSYVGNIYRTTGPEFCPQGQACRGFDPAAVTRTLVGQGTISIGASNFDRASITMTIDGTTITRTVRRQPF
jgi:hypothetical protein